MKAAQQVIDFDQVADTIVVVALDGREVELPRRDLIVCGGPRARGRYVLPESMLEAAPLCAAPPPRTRQ